jgi:hypothetical protein
VWELVRRYRMWRFRRWEKRYRAREIDPFEMWFKAHTVVRLPHHTPLVARFIGNYGTWRHKGAV